MNAIVHCTPKITQPVVPPIETKRTGVYVPAMSRYIPQWSSIWNTFFVFSFLAPWYIVEKVYSKTRLTPKTMALKSVKFSSEEFPSITNNTKPTVEAKAAIP